MKKINARKNIINFSKTIYRGTKNLWVKYHFLVPPRLWKKYFKLLWSIIIEGDNPYYDPFRVDEYNAWLEINEEKTVYEKLSYRPLISVLIPVYNVDGKYLEKCLESVLKQKYDNFEICIVDDASTKKETLNMLRKYEKNKKVRIKYRKKNGHISRATNDALAMAKGKYVALVDNDDLLAENALYEIVKVLNKNNKLDFIYSDEDKINSDGLRCDPHFKPDWSPDTLLSLNYICHLSVIRTKLVREVGGFAVGLEGAQDHDLFLKVTEKTDKIYHISKILYHWRMIPGSTALKLDNKDYANDKGKLAIEAALKRRKIKAKVEKDDESTYYRVYYNVDEEPMVSILIPTRDYAKTTEACLESLYKKTNYKNFEVILLNNNSEEEETFELLHKYENKYNNFRVIDVNIEFNYSRINNIGAKKASGDYIVLLNNDTEIISSDWLKTLVGYAMQPHIGAVGPKLLYPDNTVQHAGVILGLGGVASHAYLEERREAMGAYGRLRVSYDYAAVTAACLCVSKKKYQEVGGLEEDLKVAYNDIDFDIKLLEKGYYNVEVPMVELYHYESKTRGYDTTPEKMKRFNEEQEYMWNKWEHYLKNDVFYNPNYAKRAWFLLDKRKRGDEDEV